MSELLAKRKRKRLDSESLNQINRIAYPWLPISGLHLTSKPSSCVFFRSINHSNFLQKNFFTCDCGMIASSSWTRKRWMWCIRSIKRGASPLKISSSSNFTFLIVILFFLGFRRWEEREFYFSWVSVCGSWKKKKKERFSFCLNVFSSLSIWFSSLSFVNCFYFRLVWLWRLLVSSCCVFLQCCSVILSNNNSLAFFLHWRQILWNWHSISRCGKGVFRFS